MGFYTINSHVLGINQSDSRKIIFHHYIIRIENLQRVNRDLPRGYFKITLRNIARDLNLSTSTSRTLLKDFEDIGIVECIKKSNNSHEPSIYRYIFDNTDKTIKSTISKTTKNTIKQWDCKVEGEVDETVNCSEAETVNCTFKKEVINNKKDIYNLVIKRLNEKTCKNFRANTSKTKSLIDARLREKFTIEDFYTVIDHKVNKWIGTDMEVYLRPTTLFGTKFEGYLNEVSIKNEKFNKSINDTNTINPWNPCFDYD